MARNKGKRSSGANTDIPNGGVSLNNESNNTGGAVALPKLDESAFAGLRQKIEQRLKSENESKQRKLNNNNKSKKDADKDASKKKNGDSKKPGSKEDSTKGKKRDRNGEVIAREDKNNDRKGQSTSKDGNEDHDLRREILALGGTEEDFDLLANVDSESEVEAVADASAKSKKKTDETSLRNELAKILEAAGHVVPNDVEGEDENVDEDNAEDEADNEDESAENSSEAGGNSEDNISDVEEEVPSVAAPKAANEPAQKKKAAKESTPEPVLPKEYSKLVSIHLDIWISMMLLDTQVKGILGMKATELTMEAGSSSKTRLVLESSFTDLIFFQAREYTTALSSRSCSSASYLAVGSGK